MPDTTPLDQLPCWVCKGQETLCKCPHSPTFMQDQEPDDERQP